MHKTIATIAATFVALASHAATLPLPTGSRFVVSGPAMLGVFDDGGIADIWSFGAGVETAEGVSVGANAEIEFAARFPLADPSRVIGGFAIIDETDLVLAGDLVGLDVGPSAILMELDGLVGVVAGTFGSGAQLSFAFNAPLSGGLVGGSFYPGRITISATESGPAPVPLPASAAMLVAALILLAGAARRWSGAWSAPKAIVAPFPSSRASPPQPHERMSRRLRTLPSSA